MPCQRCILALEDAGRVLHELAYCDPGQLPEGRDWTALGTELLQVAGYLRRNNNSPGEVRADE